MVPYLPFLDAPEVLNMGLKALDPRDWIEVDGQFAAQLAERRRLLREQRDEVVAALPGSEAGQREVVGLLLDHLPARFPEIYRRTDGAIENLPTGERFRIDGFERIELAGRLVQEDFCLMSAAENGYRLVAGVLCFPSHWRLLDKLGRPLMAIHEPVPGFAERLGPTVDRFFASIRVERPVWRANWALVDTPDLFLSPEHRGRPVPVSAEDAGERLWLRVERQTLRRLPRSGDVLFTIHTSVVPLAEALGTPAATKTLAARVRAMPEDLARYKGIAPIRAPLLAWLKRRTAED
jgi:dimethylamine monooxygenase subunit A